MSEQDYIEGSRAAWRAMLGECVKQLGYDSPESTATRWVMEREDTIRQLRQACEAIGDNEWDESLYLADVVEKHLLRHVEESHNLGEP